MSFDLSVWLVHNSKTELVSRADLKAKVASAPRGAHAIHEGDLEHCGEVFVVVDHLPRPKVSLPVSLPQEISLVKKETSTSTAECVYSTGSLISFVGAHFKSSAEREALLENEPHSLMGQLFSRLGKYTQDKAVIEDIWKRSAFCFHRFAVVEEERDCLHLVVRQVTEEELRQQEREQREREKKQRERAKRKLKEKEKKKKAQAEASAEGNVVDDAATAEDELQNMMTKMDATLSTMEQEDKAEQS